MEILIFILIASVVIYNITQIQYECDIKYSLLLLYLYEYEEKEILDKLYKFATDIAKEENVPIFIKDNLGHSSGTYNYLKCKDYNEGLIRSKLLIDKIISLNIYYGFKNYDIIDNTFPRIELLKEDPWILLHELGHHFQIKNGNFNHTEIDADNYIYESIVNSNKFNILELYCLSISIKVHSNVDFKIEIDDVINYLKCNNLYSTYCEKIKESEKLNIIK
jgi:hypothetical protein